jgi:DNA-binding response OmpR family regulator
LKEGNKMKVLIVDDEADICYLLGNILKKKNVLTDFANNVADARKKIENEHPAVVFLDNHLPDGLGVNFVEHIKQVDSSIKVIMITAHDTAVDREKALNNGVDLFIGKPFTKEIIYNALDSVLN